MYKKIRITREEIKDIIRRALDEYNRIRAPEAIAKLSKIDKDLLYVEFSGSYCRTCGLYDWIEDFKYVLEDLGVRAEIIDVIEPKNQDDDKRIGIFRVDNINTVLKRIGDKLGSVKGSI